MSYVMTKWSLEREAQLLYWYGLNTPPRQIAENIGVSLNSVSIKLRSWKLRYGAEREWCKSNQRKKSRKIALYSKERVATAKSINGALHGMGCVACRYF